jgi:hypothetical protein
MRRHGMTKQLKKLSELFEKDCEIPDYEIGVEETLADLEVQLKVLCNQPHNTTDEEKTYALNLIKLDAYCASIAVRNAYEVYRALATILRKKYVEAQQQSPEI